MSDGAKPQLIIERIRERLRARKENAESPQQPVSRTSASGLSLPDLGRLRQEVAACNATHAAVGTINPRRGGPVNALIQFVKKAMRRSLTWYTRPLHQFHGSVTRSLNEITASLENHQRNLTSITASLENHQRNLASQAQSLASQTRSLEGYQRWQKEAFEKIYSRLGAVEGAAQGLEEESRRFHAARVQERLRSAERNVRRMAHLLEEEKPRPPFPKPDGQPLKASRAKAEYDFDYFLFEDRFRGSEEEIKERQRLLYLDYFKDRENVLDLGCGRGEFLEILREAGISCHGVESGLDAYLLCVEKKLEVAHQDLFAYLESVPDESLGGIFSAQVIEHLPVESQFRMVRLAQQKLSSGSPLIIETINPECVSALVRNFYLDPTHVRPVHPEMLKFVFESMSFRKTELRFSAPLSEQQIPVLDLPVPPDELARINKSLQHVNQRLFGNQDYAIIGWK